jgi:hypothetical protein
MSILFPENPFFSLSEALERILAKVSLIRITFRLLTAKIQGNTWWFTADTLSVDDRGTFLLEMFLMLMRFAPRAEGVNGWVKRSGSQLA